MFDRNSEDFILMQFTGLLDKHGKEIYELDIVSVDGVNGLVVWDDGNLQWIVKRNMEAPIPFRIGDYPDLELWYVLDDGSITKVVGNIYSNPELLKN